MKKNSTTFFCLRVVVVTVLFFSLVACGSSGSDDSGDLSGNVSSLTVESTTVDPSSEFTPSVTASVGSNGTIEFDSSPVDVNGDGVNDEVTISSVTASDYEGSVAVPLDANIGEKAVTYEFECSDTTTSSISLPERDIVKFFSGKTSGSSDTVRTKKISCSIVCEEISNDQRLTFMLVLAAVGSGWTYQSIINMVIFIYLTC